MLSLNTNISDLILQRTLLNSTFDLNEAVSRMTTGYKVNNAKDNAAGYSIIEDLNTRISSMLQIQQNTEEGISLLSTAEGGLEEIQGLLKRLRELTMQASTDTYDSKSRASLQAEADAILEEIERIKNTVSYDGQNLYETTSTNNITAPISRAARINLTSDTGDNTISLYSFIPNPVSNVDEGAQPPSSTSFSSSSSLEDTEQPLTPTLSQGEGARTMMRSAVPRATGLDSGAITLNTGETTTIYIGVEDTKAYTITNSGAGNSELIFNKDTTTGQIKFTGNQFSITGATSTTGELKGHNVKLTGGTFTFKGEAENDTIIVDSTSAGSIVYGYDGDDYIEFNKTGTAYGGNGNDHIVINVGYVSIYGQGGNDVIDINASNCSTIWGGAGNDIFNINGNSNTIQGNEDNDTFNIIGTNRTNLVIDGNQGTNTVTGAVGTNITANVEGANSYLAIINANSIVNLEINGKNYTVENTTGTQRTLTWKIESDTIAFTATTSGRGLVIRGDLNQIHNVKLANQLDFYGGNLDDIITCAQGCKIYGLDGNDTLTLASQWGSQLYGGNGDDNINLNGQLSQGFGGNGNDTIIVKNHNNNYIDSGLGINDKVTISTYYNQVYDPDGGTITDTKNTSIISGFGDSFDNALAITIDANSIVDLSLEVNGITKNYTITNSGNQSIALLYHVDQVTEEITFASAVDWALSKALKIEGDSSVSHKVNLYGYINFYGGDFDDVINIYSRGNTYGFGGRDIFNFYTDGSGSHYGGEGDDVFNAINTNQNVNLYGENGNDVFNIKILTGSTNGGNGNDTYYVEAKTKVTDTGGNNTYYINTNDTMISTRSTFRDADIAEESAKMIQAQILQKASSSLINMTRNIRQENVFGLLQGLRR